MLATLKWKTFRVSIQFRIEWWMCRVSLLFNYWHFVLYISYTDVHWQSEYSAVWSMWSHAEWSCRSLQSLSI